MSQLQTVYRFDKYNYFLGEDHVMANADGSLLLPDDDTVVAPDLKEGYWSKFNKETGKWENELIPTSCQEVIEQGLSVVSNSPEKHDRELIDLFQKLVDAEKDDYKIVVDPDTLVETIEVIPAPTLEEVREKKMQELSTKAGQYDQYKCDNMWVTVAEGYKINADIRSQTNMQGLIDTMSDSDTTLYKVFDNTFKKVTKAQLSVWKDNCILNGKNLYNQKFAYEVRIANASTVADLEAIDIEFTMMDFSQN